VHDLLPSAALNYTYSDRHETHFAPLLQMQGEVNGIALDLRCADGCRCWSRLRSRPGGDVQPSLIRTTVFDARERRAYEQEPELRL
jgi:sigma-B regulation protein RsbU (phosphoserine phosphatase)